MTDLSHGDLKAKQRELREDFDTAITLRTHRALSWLGRAEKEEEDMDARFIFLWIAFNAAYASDIDDGLKDRARFKAFFDTLVHLDQDKRIYAIVWERFSNEIRMLLDNRYVFGPFWAHHNGVPGNEDWADKLDKAKAVMNRAMATQDTPLILSVLFDRLYMLRNQLVHGGATWNSQVNRDQVRDGAAILGQLMPIFIDLMMDHADYGWDMPHYPVLDA